MFADIGYYENKCVCRLCAGDLNSELVVMGLEFTSDINVKKSSYLRALVTLRYW